MACEHLIKPAMRRRVVQVASQQANLDTHDFRLFLGNFRLHPKNFVIIGLWYPKRPAQTELL